MMVQLQNIDHVIFDIEGTICPISFVKDRLYLYFLDQIPHILSQFNYPLSSLSNSSDQLAQLSRGSQFDYEKIFLVLKALKSEDENLIKSQDAILRHFEDLVKRDIKDKCLKEFQGHVWIAGYKSDQIKVPLFPDAVDFFHAMSKASKKIYIYSSGSVPAQKLLLGHVSPESSQYSASSWKKESVDLNPLVSDYFDINTSGYKTEAKSYTRICDAIKSSSKNAKSIKADEILFFSDSILEVKAAVEAGLRSVIVDKPGNKPIHKSEKEGLVTITDFKEIQI